MGESAGPGTSRVAGYFWVVQAWFSLQLSRLRKPHSEANVPTAGAYMPGPDDD